ncbi:MAG TPA: GNAT family N-acetyltransferase [Roseiflexaceae bacterium]|nr:GNAT family N-acetyltransferase [Roseiflexaceae bacterium]
MIFPDHALACRIEAHTAWSCLEHAHCQAQIAPPTESQVRPIGGGWAGYRGRQSPLSKVYGIGLTDALQPDDLTAIEAWYCTRRMPIRIRLSPYTDRGTLAFLGQCGYTISDFMDVYARQIGIPLPFAAPAVRVTQATEAEARHWFARSGAGGDWAEPDGITFMTIRSVLKRGSQLYLAWVDGEPVSGAAIEIHDGIAELMAAATMPAFRGRGLHTALLHARIAAAAAAGCDLIITHAVPGALSQKNLLQAGFAQLYTAVVVATPGNYSEVHHD